MSLNMVIGLTGYAQSGKDTAARHLIENYGFTRVAFADKLREAMYTLNPEIKTGWVKRERLQDIVDDVGWENAKLGYPEVRRLLQVFGTEVGRMMFGENVWVDVAAKDIVERNLDNVVLTDVRFQNEAAWVKSQGGIIVRINRSGVGPVNGHISDSGIDAMSVDFVVPNDGTIEALYAGLDDVMRLVASE